MPNGGANTKRQWNLHENNLRLSGGIFLPLTVEYFITTAESAEHIHTPFAPLTKLTYIHT